jgi:hypothetical protein
METWCERCNIKINEDKTRRGTTSLVVVDRLSLASHWMNEIFHSGLLGFWTLSIIWYSKNTEEYSSHISIRVYIVLARNIASSFAFSNPVLLPPPPKLPVTVKLNSLSDAGRSELRFVAGTRGTSVFDTSRNTQTNCVVGWVTMLHAGRSRVPFSMS